jgi:hypothetical protein
MLWRRAAAWGFEVIGEQTDMKSDKLQVNFKTMHYEL